MNKSLLMVRLYDDTTILARGWKFEEGQLLVEDIVTRHKDEDPLYISDTVAISKDAIRVWFRILKGGEDE